MANRLNRTEIIYELFTDSDGELSATELSKMSNYELMDTYLSWYGIIGYTQTILEHVAGIFNVEINY